MAQTPAVLFGNRQPKGSRRSSDGGNNLLKNRNDFIKLIAQAPSTLRKSSEGFDIHAEIEKSPSSRNKVRRSSQESRNSEFDNYERLPSSKYEKMLNRANTTPEKTFSSILNRISRNQCSKVPDNAPTGANESKAAIRPGTLRVFADDDSFRTLKINPLTLVGEVLSSLFSRMNNKENGKWVLLTCHRSLKLTQMHSTERISSIIERHSLADAVIKIYFCRLGATSALAERLQRLYPAAQYNEIENSIFLLAQTSQNSNENSIYSTPEDKNYETPEKMSPSLQSFDPNDNSIYAIPDDFSSDKRGSMLSDSDPFKPSRNSIYSTPDDTTTYYSSYEQFTPISETSEPDYYSTTVDSIEHQAIAPSPPSLASLTALVNTSSQSVQLQHERESSSIF